MRPGVIFFDIGNTLIRGAELSARRLLASRLGLSEKETKRAGKLIMVHPAREVQELAAELSRVLPSIDRNRLETVLKEVWREQAGCPREIPGATLLLRALKAKGFQIGALSNIWHPFYMGFRQACPEMAALMDYSVLSYRQGIKKPSVELFRLAVEETGRKPSECWMVGDSYELDMVPARAAGMRTLWVLHRPERESALLARLLRGELPPPDWTVDTLDSIMDYFDREDSTR